MMRNREFLACSLTNLRTTPAELTMSMTEVEVSNEALVRDRAIRLFTYLKELTELRSDVKRSCEDYDQVIWLAQIPKEKGCYCAAWDIGRGPAYDEWIRVDRPRRKQPPTPPSALSPWLSDREIADASLDAPQLKDSIVEELSSMDPATGARETVVRKLEDHPAVKRQWELYVENQWWPWALEERRLVPVQGIYNQLFAAYQNLERMGEAYEAVLGFGLLAWHPPHSPEIKRHVAVAQMAVEFDSETGVITVGAAADGSSLMLEQDMLEPQDRPLPGVQTRIQEELAAIGDDVWAGPELAAALNAYYQQLWPEGELDMALEPDEAAADPMRPQMRLAPALLVRRRSDRNLVRIFSEIASQLEQGGPIPLGVEKLVSIKDDQQCSDGVENTSGSVGENGAEDELYFPLDANEAQRQIAQRLASRQGVLVQGPPGTGKSHTIANLICHLLATGKRLLITSHTARALRVLKGHLPAEFSPLCVSLLGDDGSALRELEESVQGILSQFNQWDSSQKQARISQLAGDIDSSRRDLAEGYSKLKAIRASETKEVERNFGGYYGTPQVLASRLAADAGRLDWIGTHIDPEQEAPLNDGEAVLLLRLIRELNHDEDESQRLLPELAVVPNPVRFEELALKERELVLRIQPAATESGLLFDVLASVSAERRRVLEVALREQLAMYDGLSSNSEEWVKTAIQEVTGGNHHLWESLAAATKAKLEFLKDHVDRVAQLRVTGIEKRDRAEVRTDAEMLREHLMSGGSVGRALRYNPFTPKRLKACLYLVDEVRVNGRGCETCEQIDELFRYLDVLDGFQYVDEQWSPYLAPTNLPMLLHFGEQIWRAELLNEILKLRDKGKALAAAVAGIPNAASLRFDTGQAVANVLEFLAIEAVRDELRAIEAELALALAELRRLRRDPNGHPVAAQLLAAAEDRNVNSYYETHSKILSAWELRSRHQQCKGLEAQLGKPDLITEIRASLDNPIWDERMANFVAAWNWLRTSVWLLRHADPQQESSLRHQIDISQNRIRRGLQELGACKAWKFVLARLKPEQREHLVAWRQAMKKGGKGTGKYAAQYRKEAREHLDHCRGAIPAWVMPIYRVAETTRPAPDLFDVAIIDEASQSGPEALFLQYIARKIVVVGDDQQISPENVGLDRSSVNALRDRYIKDFPHSDAMGVDNSFFSQAEIRFAGRIRLREHFRCMPEIIQFSNNLCYQAEPLIPLRQYGRERLSPVLTRHVEGGHVKGSANRKVNPPEAEAIAHQIAKCIENPSYDGKNFGVISLQGSAQANLISDLLMDKIGAQKVQERHIVCGDAYAFQGDERDVIFLSMVAAANDGGRIGVLSREADKRRFNVAASRARDQMWLFHSVAVDDLSRLCLRRQLLEYCLNPNVRTQVVEGIDVSVLRQQALEANRTVSRASLPFDSWFEVDVFLQIVDRGFRVIPQYEMAGKWIDLLIDGMQGRLAVECDGDQWHGLEEWDRDVDRQRMLERCGLEFWRVRGSAYYRNRAAALEPLWRALEKRGIFPDSQAKTRPKHHGAGQPAEVIEEDPTECVNHNEGSQSQPEDEDLGSVEVAAEEDEDPENLPVEPINLGFVLTPYVPWASRPVPNPHSASFSALFESLVEIVTAEGPMVSGRLYSLFNKAAGYMRLRQQMVGILDRVVCRGVRLGCLVQEQTRCGQMERVLRIPGSPEVNLRERGPRALDEIPCSEITAVRERLRQSDEQQEQEQLVRQLAAAYGVRRLTPQIRRMLL